MLSQFEHYIQQQNLIDSNEVVIVALSGGIDSMVMLKLLQNSSFNNLVIAHCNFNLRNNDSNLDQEFVENYCKQHQLPLFVKSFDTKSYASEQGISIQMAARDLRYNWFQELSIEKGFSKIALAQHLDDQVETFFINLIRGTGISGIHGILPINGNLIRPMLFCTRNEIEKYQLENNIPYREDQSNKSDKYMRNYIRHNIAPKFESIAPNFAYKLDTNIQNFKEVEDFYKTSINKNLSKLITEKDTDIFIDINKLNSLDFIELHLRELLTKKGFNSDTINKVYLQLKNPSSGKSFDSPSHELLFNREEIIIRNKKQQNFTQYLINRETNISAPIQMQVDVVEHNLSSLKTEPNIALFDIDKLVFPLTLRNWKSSDSFVPLGMKGRKKLSDFFIDNKLSIFEKKKTWVLLSENVIIWVVGYRIDDRFKVTKQTKNIYKIIV